MSALYYHYHADSTETAQLLAARIRELSTASDAQVTQQRRRSVQLQGPRISGEAVWAVTAALRGAALGASIADTNATAALNEYIAAAARTESAQQHYQRCRCEAMRAEGAVPFAEDTSAAAAAAGERNAAERAALVALTLAEAAAERAAQRTKAAQALAADAGGAVGVVCVWYAARPGDEALGALAAAALALRSVVRLRLVGCALGPKAAVALGAALQRNSTLEELDVSGNPALGAAGVRAIFLGLNVRAEEDADGDSAVSLLNLAHCRLDDDEAGAAVAEGLAANFALRTLCFQCNCISDATAALLVRALTHSNQTLVDFGFSIAPPRRRSPSPASPPPPPTEAAAAVTVAVDASSPTSAPAPAVVEAAVLSESWRQALLDCVRSRRFVRMDTQQKPPADAPTPSIERFHERYSGWSRPAKAGF